MKAMIRFSILLFLVSGLQAATAQTPTRLRLKQLELAPDTAYVIYSKDDGTAIWKAFSSVLSAGGGVTGPLTSGRIPRATGTYTLGDGVLRDDGTLLALGGATVSGYSFYDYSTGAWRLATGTTAQRPGSPTAGAMRYNTTEGTWEYYGASAWEVPVKSSTTTGLFTAGSVLFANANGRAAQDNTNLFWDDTNNRLGVGYATPASTLEVRTPDNYNGATITGPRSPRLYIGGNTGSGSHIAGVTNSNDWATGATAGDLVLRSEGGAVVSGVAGGLTLAVTSNSVGINKRVPSYTLDLTSTGGIRGAVGTTAQRPTAANGVFRLNTDLSIYEGYMGSNWRQMSFPVGTTNYTLRFDGSTWVTSNSFTNTNTVVALNASGAQLNVTDSQSAVSTITPVTITGNSTATVRLKIKNSNAGAAADTRLILENNINRVAGFYMGSGVAGRAIYFADNNMIFMPGSYTATGATKTTAFYCGGYDPSNEKMRITPTGVHIGDTTSAARTLHVTGEARITDLTTDTPTRIVGADADGDLGAITVGSGLSLSAGTLTATATGTMSSFTIAGDAGTPQTISDGNTLDVEGGFGINTTASATDKVVVEVDTTQIATQSDLAAISPTTLYTGDGTIATDRTVTIDDNYALITSGSPGVLSFTGTSGYVSSLSAYGYAYEIADTAFYITNATVKQSGSGSTIWYIQAGRQDATTLAVAEVNGDGGVTLGSIKTAGESSLVLDGQSITHTADLSHITKIGATTIHTTTSTGVGINDTSPEKSLDVGGMGKFRQLSGQDNSVTIGTNANAGTGRSASVTGSQSSDVAGRFSFTSGTGLTAGEWVTLTWGTAFDNPPAVVLMPEDANGASITPYLFVQPTTTGCSIQVNVTGAPYEGLTYSFNYIVIQGK